MVPSCVPATHMATAGAYLEAKDIAALQNDPWVLGLAEMMNYPGVVHEDPGVMEKIEAFRTRVLDGHAPGTDRQGAECLRGRRHRLGSRVHHASKRRRRSCASGMYILIREATNAHNLARLCCR